jgi:hypothetical protein
MKGSGSGSVQIIVVTDLDVGRQKKICGSYRSGTLEKGLVLAGIVFRIGNNFGLLEPDLAETEAKNDNILYIRYLNVLSGELEAKKILMKVYIAFLILENVGNILRVQIFNFLCPEKHCNFF